MTLIVESMSIGADVCPSEFGQSFNLQINHLYLGRALVGYINPRYKWIRGGYLGSIWGIQYRWVGGGIYLGLIRGIRKMTPFYLESILGIQGAAVYLGIHHAILRNFDLRQMDTSERDTWVWCQENSCAAQAQSEVGRKWPKIRGIRLPRWRGTIVFEREVNLLCNIIELFNQISHNVFGFQAFHSCEMILMCTLNVKVLCMNV